MFLRGFLWALVITVALSVIAALSLWLLPELLVGRTSVQLAGKDRIDALASARTATVALVASFATAASVFVAARAYVMTRFGMQGEILSRSAEEMFSDEASRRTAAVYAVAGHARYSAPSRRVAISVLSAYVRDGTKSRNEEDPLDGAIVLAVEALSTVKRPRKMGVDLSNARLYDINLSGYNLSGWIFDGAKLDGADLSKAKVRRTSFRSASLAGADLSGMRRRSDATFTDADLRGVNQ